MDSASAQPYPWRENNPNLEGDMAAMETTTAVVRFDDHALHVIDHIAHTLEEIHHVIERLARAIEAQAATASD
jgi:hypothetical protein